MGPDSQTKNPPKLKKIKLVHVTASILAEKICSLTDFFMILAELMISIDFFLLSKDISEKITL